MSFYLVYVNVWFHLYGGTEIKRNFNLVHIEMQAGRVSSANISIHLNETKPTFS